jgi:hypothetical protein
MRMHGLLRYSIMREKMPWSLSWILCWCNDLEHHTEAATLPNFALDTD